jgi:hypothetical protein
MIFAGRQIFGQMPFEPLIRMECDSIHCSNVCLDIKWSHVQSTEQNGTKVLDTRRNPQPRASFSATSTHVRWIFQMLTSQRQHWRVEFRGKSLGLLESKREDRLQQAASAILGNIRHGRYGMVRGRSLRFHKRSTTPSNGHRIFRSIDAK